MEEIMAKKSLEEKIEVTKSVLKENLNTVRAGRANPALLDKVMVSYYGTMTPLKSLSNITTPDPRTLMVTPFDAGSMISCTRLMRLIWVLIHQVMVRLSDLLSLN